MVQQQDVNGGDVISPKEVDYGYNALGQFTSAADFNFIGVGPRTDVLTGAYSYDNGARLTGIAYTSNGGATTIDTLGWGFDAASNVTSFTSIDGEADYGYDATNQLTSATYTTSPGGHQTANETFSFDKNGNRTMAGYTTGDDNLLASDGTFNYQHDADGNTTIRTRISTAYATDYQTTYTWDYRNRLTDVEYFDNNAVLTKHVHFVYGVFDHLIATEVDSTGSGQYDTVQRYVLDVSPEIPSAGVPGTALAQPVLQFDGNQTLTVRFLVGLDPTGGNAIVAQEAVPSRSQGGPAVWAADDNLGTPRDLVDNSGTLANHRVFSAFGQDEYESDPSLSYWVGFSGGHLDATTALVNNYHRWYDPGEGKWLSKDPSGCSAGDSDLMRFVGNDPVNIFDRTGLSYKGPYNPNTIIITADIETWHFTLSITAEEAVETLADEKRMKLSEKEIERETEMQQKLDAEQWSQMKKQLKNSVDKDFEEMRKLEKKQLKQQQQDEQMMREMLNDDQLPEDQQ